MKTRKLALFIAVIASLGATPLVYPVQAFAADDGYVAIAPLVAGVRASLDEPSR
mgnify:CR=1 FL=1